MKKHLYILIAVAVFAACGTTKRASRSEASTVTAEQSTTDRTAESAGQTTESSSEATIIRNLKICKLF